MRLCHSRMLFVRAYPRETQEMVMDGHDRAFAFFKGACTRGIYDNMKTAVGTIMVGREGAYKLRFLQMCSHYLVEPAACTPASGWEERQVENHVGLVRERFFTPRLSTTRFIDLAAVVWANNTVRVMARNISGATFDLAAVALSVGAAKNGATRAISPLVRQLERTPRDDLSACRSIFSQIVLPCDSILHLTWIKSPEGCLPLRSF